ncbi:MAG: secretin N-terminal domain-containing protein [Patescibacteria group bacterium]
MRNSASPYLRRLLGLVLLGLLIVSLSVTAANQVLDSVNYKNADLRDVLNALAAQAGVSVFMDETVTGAVSFHFENVTFEDCLNRLAAMYRLQVKKEGRFYTVTRQIIKVTKEAEGLYSLELQMAKLRAVLAELTRVTGVNLTLTGQEPTEHLNLVLGRLPLADLISLLAESARCQVEKRSGAYIFRQVASLGSMSVKYEEGRLSADLSGVPLSVLVRELSSRTGLAVICDQAAAAVQVNVFFAPLPLDEALGAIAAANGLRVFKEGGHYRFSRGESTGGVKVSGGLLTLDVRNAEITEILSEVARQAGITILPDRDVSGRASGNIAQAGLVEGLSAFLEANGFVLEREGNAFTVKRLMTGQSIVISINEDGTIDLEVNNASLATAATELAKKKNYNLVIYANVNWNVTSVRLVNASFEEALGRLLAGTTFTFRKDGDTYLVGEGVNFRQGDTDFIQSEVIPLRYITAESIWNSLPTVYPRQNIILLKETNSLLVNGTPKLIAALKAFLAKVDVPQETIRSEVVALRHMKAEDALKLFPPGIPKTELVLVKETNSIVVTGNEGYRAQVRDFLAKIDVMAPMILFDTLVLQFSETETKGGGLSSATLTLDGQTLKWDLGSLIGTIISPNTPAAAQLTASINAAITSGRARVRANPKIATLSGFAAQFNVVTKYNYPVPTTSSSTTTTTTEYRYITIDSGIQLTMTPWVSANKEITLELKPSISQFTTSPEVSSEIAALPGVMERSTQSTVRIMDGYTVVISGFIQESEDINVSKVPILGYLPIIGKLFQNTKRVKRQDEFVIIITPRLIEDPAQINQIVADIQGTGSTAGPIVIDMDEDKK